MIWIYSPARDDIGFGRRAVDADILQGVGERLGQRGLVRWSEAGCA